MSQTPSDPVVIGEPEVRWYVVFQHAKQAGFNCDAREIVRPDPKLVEMDDKYNAFQFYSELIVSVEYDGETHEMTRRISGSREYYPGVELVSADFIRSFAAGSRETFVVSDAKHALDQGSDKFVWIVGRRFFTYDPDKHIILDAEGNEVTEVTDPSFDKLVTMVTGYAFRVLIDGDNSLDLIATEGAVSSEATINFVISAAGGNHTYRLDVLRPCSHHDTLSYHKDASADERERVAAEACELCGFPNGESGWLFESGIESGDEGTEASMFTASRSAQLDSRLKLQSKTRRDRKELRIPILRDDEPWLEIVYVEGCLVVRRPQVDDEE